MTEPQSDEQLAHDYAETVWGSYRNLADDERSHFKLCETDYSAGLKRGRELGRAEAFEEAADISLSCAGYSVDSYDTFKKMAKAARTPTP